MIFTNTYFSYQQLNVLSLQSVADKAETCVSFFWKNWLDKSEVAGLRSADAPELVLRHRGVTQWPVVFLGSSHAGCEAELCWEMSRECQGLFFLFHWNKDYKKQQLNLLSAKFQKSMQDSTGSEWSKGRIRAKSWGTIIRIKEARMQRRAEYPKVY